MPRLNILKESKLIETARLMQLRGLFDIARSATISHTWEIDFNLPDTWNIGVVVGPSGCGKSTLINSVWPDHIAPKYPWSENKALIDDFPKSMGISEICDLLSSVGFSSPPSWMKPFHVLSNGEQFRCTLARTLAEQNEMVVVDEFTSVVDRNAAKIGSAAFAKCVRRKNRQAILSTCHSDVIEWLEPDWVYEPHLNRLQVAVGRGLWRRPPVTLELCRVHPEAWQLFAPHHYLSATHHNAARCYVATFNGAPAVWCSFLHFPHPHSKNIKREHRTVCLPDYQGIGLGNTVSNTIASMVKGLGYRYLSQTSHPAFIKARVRSGKWVCIMAPKIRENLASKSRTVELGKSFGASINDRLMATLEYIGPAMSIEQAKMLYGDGVSEYQDRSIRSRVRV